MLRLEKLRRADPMGLEWYLDVFYDDIKLEAVRLYDPKGWFVAEFYDLSEAERFVDTVGIEL